MTKSRERPTCGASRRRSLAQRAWKVEIHMPDEVVPTSEATRSRISSAALFVKVTASTSAGSAIPLPTR